MNTDLHSQKRHPKQTKSAGDEDFCLTLGNHWSFTGIGWQAGIESCAQSISDSLAMTEYDPRIKTCLNLDPPAYELVTEHFPDIAARLRTAWQNGLVEIIGGSYGQPMGSMISGESTVRQLVMGQRSVANILGKPVETFLEEEEFSHPQIPQLLSQAGYRFASLAQCDTWGKHGSPVMDLNLVNWRGVDGTTILATPVNGLVFHPPVVTVDIDWLWSKAGRAKLSELGKLGMPLVIKWTEFGWEPLRGKAMNKFDPEKFRELSKRFRVRYTTLTEYLDGHAGEAKQTAELRMDDFQKLLPWGVGGDQIRIFGRKVEALLLAAERFDAIAELLDLPTKAPKVLEQAWKDLLISQSHDVSLCEYSRGQGFPSQMDTIFDAHFQTWGSIGFHHLDRAKAGARAVIDYTLKRISRAVDTTTQNGGDLAITVFNPSGFHRHANAQTGKFYVKEKGCNYLLVTDTHGRTVPSQLVGSGRRCDGSLVHADLLLSTRELPSLGYTTYSVAFHHEPVESPTTDLHINEELLTMENAHVSVEICASTGTIKTLKDRRSGRLLIGKSQTASPTLTGRPNPAYSLRAPVPASYDSSKSTATIDWTERGPLRATIKSLHIFHGLRFELFVTLHANSPAVEVRARVSADIPPCAEPTLGGKRINAWQYPLHITEGYWLNWALGFVPQSVIRDYPFGVEATTKKAIDALTFVDFVTEDGGLLLMHSGTQYFKRKSKKVFSNLVVREWESTYTGEYGWPRVSSYRYVLLPHGPEFSNADRIRAVAEFDQPPICLTDIPHAGKLPPRQSFLQFLGDDIVLSTFRSRTNKELELRLVECAGKEAKAKLSVHLPLNTLQTTNLLGTSSGSILPLKKGHLVSLKPWEIKTFSLSSRDKKNE